MATEKPIGAGYTSRNYKPEFERHVDFLTLLVRAHPQRPEDAACLGGGGTPQPAADHGDGPLRPARHQNQAAD
jgi:hypothetical protein